MRRVYFFSTICFLCSLFCVPFFARAANNSVLNIGFVQNPIWYSKDPFVEGDTVRIYTFLFNPGPGAFTGTVEFDDANVVLGTRPFSLEKGAAEDLSVSWKVTAGDHSISAKIIGPKMTLNGKTEPLALADTVTSEDKRFVPKTIAEALPAKNPASATGTPNTFPSADKIISNADTYVASTTKNVPFLSAVDSFRMDTAKTFTVDETAVKAQLAKPVVAPKSAVSANGSSPIPPSLRRPLDYVSLFFYTLLAFIFSHTVIFYGLIVLILFFILRFFYRLLA